MQPRYFKTPAALRAWFEKNSTSKQELLVGFYKRGSGHPSITWPESVDQALCFGWIDGVRHRLDDDRYTIRFTPRKARSIWSAVNIKRMKELEQLGETTPAGTKAFAARLPNRSGAYSFEQRSVELPPEYAKILAGNLRALAFFESQPPSYRKAAMWWVVSAKQEETRLRRLQTLIADSTQSQRLKQLRRDPPS
jgi:uncharacterized protein YdeI (YjbR/CyaY-like superfamily)